MIKYAYGLDDKENVLDFYPELNIYSELYGVTPKDLGLYALVDNKIAGALWCRQLCKEHGASGFIDENTPVLSMSIFPEFREKKVGTTMMEQFLLEASTCYEQISIALLSDSTAILFYEKFGFEIVEGSHKKSKIHKREILIMLKKLDKKELVRPSDGYDPRRWMD
ncbi:GNAT family N-acetyltransferase [Sulfurimonas aquatica]|uniref:GNAT family N-acetyltransferase n=2 Tax=Sulfurimonas aquatica TaxID=2672570 RepID=A0A975B2Q9_9BACT|nr:GNAT family N-acetyltransferase [Sulfurimonas aquatica]